jgi:hypothetical protein
MRVRLLAHASGLSAARPSDPAALEDQKMTVLTIYVVLVAIFEVIIVAVGLAVDSVVPAGWNVMVAVTMFFAVIWGMWPVAVYITERWFNGSAKSGAQVQTLR